MDDKLIIHYGVIGQKWGVIKKRESELRSKAKTVEKMQSKLPNATKMDVASANWMSKTIPQKFVSAVISATSVAVMHYSILGLMDKPQDLSKIAKKALVTTVTSIATAEYQGRSSLKRYTKSGNRDLTKKQYKKLTPETVIASSVRLGVALAPIAARVAKAGLQKAAYDHKKNREIFEGWGQNILPKTTSEFQAIYDDGYMSILERIKP